MGRFGAAVKTIGAAVVAGAVVLGGIGAGARAAFAAAPEQTVEIVREGTTIRASWNAPALPAGATKLKVVLPAEVAEMQFDGLSWSVYSGAAPTIDGFAPATATTVEVDVPQGLEPGTTLSVSVRSVEGPWLDRIDLNVNVPTGAASGSPNTAQVQLELSNAAQSDLKTSYKGATSPALLVAGEPFAVKAAAGFWTAAAAMPGVVGRATLGQGGGGNPYPLTYTISADGSVLELQLPDPIPADAVQSDDRMTVSFLSSQWPRTSEIVFSTPVLIGGPLTADRIDGADRYAVSAAVAQRSFRGEAAVAYVATGETFADALSAAPAATKQGGPLLLTRRTALPPVVKAELERLKPQRIVVVGGPASVAEGVLGELGAIAPTERVGGADRYEVSRNLLASVFPGDLRRVFVATGATFPDALTAGAAAGSARVPVVLVRGAGGALDGATDAALRAYPLRAITLVGGPVSVSPGVEASLSAITRTTRLAGPDRYSTSRVLNAFAFPSASHAYLVSGTVFSDALVGSALAGEQDVPVFTVRTDCVPMETLSALRRASVDTATLIGGPATLTQRVLDLEPCAVG
jgi:putative cell wall-binding protein